MRADALPGEAPGASQSKRYKDQMHLNRRNREYSPDNAGGILRNSPCLVPKACQVSATPRYFTQRI
jgi:hypothetical protein